MLKTLIVILVFSFNCFSKEILLKYAYGDTSSVSEIIIYKNGDIHSLESKCCPKVKNEEILNSLTSEGLRELKENMHLARFGPFLHSKVSERHPKYGQVLGSLDGQEIILSEKLEEEKWLMQNESLASKEILKFLMSLDPHHKWKSSSKE